MSGSSSSYNETEAQANLARDKRNREACESLSKTLYKNAQGTVKVEREEIEIIEAAPRKKAPTAAFQIQTVDLASKKREHDRLMAEARAIVAVKSVNSGTSGACDIVIVESSSKTSKVQKERKPALPEPRKASDVAAPDRILNIQEMSSQHEVLVRTPGQVRAILSQEDVNRSDYLLIRSSNKDVEAREIHSLAGDGTNGKIRSVREAFAESGQLQIAFEGVSVSKAKPKERVSEDNVKEPTWFFFAQECEILTPASFPMALTKTQRMQKGVTLERVQACAVASLLQTNKIEAAVYVVPKTEEEIAAEFAENPDKKISLTNQWIHTAKVKKVAHVVGDRSQGGIGGALRLDSSIVGKVLPTCEVMGRVVKETKADEPKFLVICEIRSKTGMVHLETEFASEARARSAAIAAVSFSQGGEAGKEGFTQIGGAERATVRTLGDKVVLNPEMYPLTGSKSENGKPVRAWDFSEHEAIITRDGAMALEKDPKADEYKGHIPNIWTKRHSSNANWTQRCRNDKSTFSGNRSVERGVRF